MRFPIALRREVDDRDFVIEAIRRENRELREGLKRANAELRNLKALVADLRTDPDKTLERIQKAFREGTTA